MKLRSESSRAIRTAHCIVPVERREFSTAQVVDDIHNSITPTKTTDGSGAAVRAIRSG